MGDRANIVIRDGTKNLHTHEAVFLYTHWGGHELPSALQEGLKKAQGRWDDAPYLSRILFQTLIDGDDRNTGFGISTRLTDNSYSLLVVDVVRQVVAPLDENHYETFGFSKLSEAQGIPIPEYALGEWTWDKIRERLSPT